VAAEKETIEQQVAEARASLEVDSRRLAVEISSRVLHRPITSS
jgi:hypothetical protein